MPAEGPCDLDADGLERGGQRAFDDVEDHLRPRVRNLEVDLREFELPIRTLILVAEAARELDVAIHPRDHQDLLEDLRRLREREELAGMHAARHQEVARALGSGLGQDRRFDLPEALIVEIVPERERDLVPEADVPLQLRPAQVEIAVLQADLFRNVHLFGNRERRRLRLVENPDIARAHFDFTSRHVGVGRFRRAALDLADHRDHVLGPQALDPLEQRSLPSTMTCAWPSRSRTSIKSREPRSRTLCVQPRRTTSLPTSAARSAPQVWVRVRLPSCSDIVGIRIRDQGSGI
jgi:hypothetical protein